MRSICPFNNFPCWGGFHSTKGFLIAKSKNNDVQIYIKATKFEEKDGVQVATEYGLTAEYKGKEVSGNWMLCGPDKEKNKYFLLKSGDSWWWNWNDMNGKGVLCDTARENDTFGEELSIEFLKEAGGSVPTYSAKSIFLKSCKIEELEKTSMQVESEKEKNKTKFVVTCSTKAQQDVSSSDQNNQVRLVDKGLF